MFLANWIDILDPHDVSFYVVRRLNQKDHWVCYGGA